MVLLNTRIGLFRQIDNRPGSDPNLVLSHIQEILACSTVRGGESLSEQIGPPVIYGILFAVCLMPF